MSDPPWSDKERLAELGRQIALRDDWTLEQAARICCGLYPFTAAIPDDRRADYEETLRELDAAEQSGRLVAVQGVSDEADPFAEPGAIRRHLRFKPINVFRFAMDRWRPSGSPVLNQRFPYGAEHFRVAPNTMTTALVKAMAVASSFLSAPAPAPAVAASRDHAPEDRKAVVDGFIDRVLDETGQKITRTDIWQVAGYSDRTTFQAWQRRDAGYEDGGGVDQQFCRVVNLPAADFIRRRQLSRQGQK